MSKTTLANSYFKVMEACAAYVAETKPDCNSPEVAYQILLPLIEASTSNQQEAFYMIPLDNKKKMLEAPIEIFRGVLSACYISPREVFKKALMVNAASIIIAHNHPSGNPEPSVEDIAVTKKMIECGRLLDIPVIDHIICGTKTPDNEGFISMSHRTYYLFL